MEVGDTLLKSLRRGLGDISLESLRMEVGDTLLKGLRRGARGYLVEEEKGEEEDEAHRNLLTEDSQRQACLCDGEPAGVVTGVWHVRGGRARRLTGD